MKKTSAFCPAGISSFFGICDLDTKGKLITEPEHLGAIGGGFVINKGVTTEVQLTESEEENIVVSINGIPTPKAETTKTVVRILLKKTARTWNVGVKHQFEVPIGAGFGSSAAGALSTALCLSRALNINLTYNQVGHIAHVAEIMCKTGLGTVGPLMLGGCVLTVEPGPPGGALIDRIPTSPDYRIICGVFQALSTKRLLISPEKKGIINEWGKKTVKSILDNPTVGNFMSASKRFALGTGLSTPRVRRLMDVAEKIGAVGAAQNMVGEAVHALVTLDNFEKVLQTFRKHLSNEKIYVGKIALRGARLLE